MLLQITVGAEYDEECSVLHQPSRDYSESRDLPSESRDIPAETGDLPSDHVTGPSSEGVEEMEHAMDQADSSSTLAMKVHSSWAEGLFLSRFFCNTWS